MEKWEKKLSEVFDGVIMVSAEDVELVRQKYGLDNVLGDVPAGVDADYFQPCKGEGERPATVGFLGSMDWMPNVEAVKWFAGDIFPVLKEGVPGLRLLVIGRRPPPSIRALASQDAQIEVTGTVDDVRPFLARCDLLVVPLLSGGGTRIKIMESLAAGLPVVSTAIGAEGLGLVDGEHLLIADSGPEFVAAVSRLIADEELRQRLIAAGRELVRTRYSWARATEVFMERCLKVRGRLAAGSEIR
jgi:glycosyltransferase involved in cell wall biosynthesis